MTQHAPPGPISEFFEGLSVGVFENVEKRQQEREKHNGNTRAPGFLAILQRGPARLGRVIITLSQLNSTVVLLAM